MNRKAQNVLLVFAAIACIILLVRMAPSFTEKSKSVIPARKPLILKEKKHKQTQTSPQHLTEKYYAQKSTSALNVPNPDRQGSEHDARLAVNLGPETDRITDELLIRFKSMEDMRAFLENVRGSGLTVLDSSERLLVVRLQAFSPEELTQYFDSEHLPENISGNHLVYTPNLPEQRRRGTQQSYSSFGNNGPHWLGLNRQASQGGSGILVAVLDTGVENHETIDPARFSRIDLVGESNDFEGNFAGHGTGVAAIIAGQATYAPGMASNVDILSIRVLDDAGMGNSFTVAEGIMVAVEQGAEVINLSLGSFADSPILKKAVEYARSQGVVLVAATGNDGISEIMYPARYDGVVAVGAVDAKKQVLPFSNQGSEIDITAPGFGVQTAWSDNQIVSFSGTSASAAFVSGAIADLLSDSQSLTAQEAAVIVLNFADDGGGPGKDELYGHGILNYRRISERNTPGIYDIAVGGYFLPKTVTSDNNMTVPIVITIQNRGTEPIQQAGAVITVDGQKEEYVIGKLEAGKSKGISANIDLDKLMAGKSSVVAAEVYLITCSDLHPGNNMLRTIITLKSE
jgi:subtilisin family serine protease